MSLVIVLVIFATGLMLARGAVSRVIAVVFFALGVMVSDNALGRFTRSLLGGIYHLVS